ncbi:MAG: ABC transporter permease subunit, partial [Gammaproteobacteria bacterium]
GLGFLTFARVILLIAVASLIWVPIGVWIGLRPAWSQRIQPVAQFLAAFPVNILFPFVVMGIVAWRLNPDIWLSPLIVLGTQWYILFNVVAGASVLPTDLKEAAGIFHLRSWQRWRDLILPGIFPYYVTGALTASGGSWNASIVAEFVTWKHTQIQAAGLGSYIAENMVAGDFPRVALGSTVISVFVLAMNHSLWRPMYRYAEKNLRLN